jgi:hypothetical protein
MKELGRNHKWKRIFSTFILSRKARVYPVAVAVGVVCDDGTVIR